MVSSMIPIDVAPDEPWKTLAMSASDLDPGETIRPPAPTIVIRPPASPAPLSSSKREEAWAAKPPITIPELPLLAVAQGGAPLEGPVGADLEVVGLLGEGG